MRLSIIVTGYVVYGIVVLLLAADLLLESREALAVAALVACAIWGFMSAGFKMGKSKGDKPDYEPIMFEDLDPATYVVSENPYVSVYIQAESFSRYFMLVECITRYNRWPTVIEIPKDKNNRYKLQVAMGKFVEKMKAGEGFKVNKDHNITKLGT